jgi:GntR family transcriptional regulator/MocR family aminotransferase
MDLHLDLDAAAGHSLRARLENGLRDGIRSGLLAPLTRMPSQRALAAQLGVSRGVVVEAYAQLAAEGYLHARAGACTTVAAAHSAAGTTSWGVRAPRRTRGRAEPALRHDLSPFVPALDAFPRRAWGTALARVLREAPDERFALPDLAGAVELRTALASYLARARGVRAGAEQIVICNGLRAGLGLLWSALAAAGATRVAVEDPGWRGISETAVDARLRPVRIGVDDEGIRVERLDHHAPIDAVAVAPAHQYPTGAVLSAARRAALVGWAREQDALIVEDDYDAEYRYDREPVGSLQGLAPEHVVYCGSTSKSLAPSVRLGWVVVPPRLVAPMTALQRRRGGMPATLMQLALAELVERGELDRHLRRQRRAYRRRRDTLLAALSEKLPEATVHGAAAGLFLTVRLPPGTDEREVIRLARAVGVVVLGLGEAGPGLVVGYANLSEAAIAPAVDALAASVRGARAV